MTNQLQSLGNLLPQQVTVTAVQRNISQGQNPANTESGIPFGSPSFFDLNISDDSGILDGSFDSYCIDFDRFLNFEGFDFNGDGDTSDNGITLPTVGGAPFDELAPVDFSASVYSSYDDAVLNDGLGGLIEKPQNLGMVNWLINNQDIFLSQGFSVGDIQTAIWALVDLQDSELVGGNVPLTQFDRDYFTDMFGGFSDANVANIVAEAQNYADFVPQAGQKVAVILVPDGNTTGDPDTDTDPDGHPDGVPDGQIIIAAVELAKLGDKVFEDLNANGIQDDNDPGIAGATVNLLADLDGDGVIEDGEVVDSTTTDANGNYHFTVLPGDYKVEFETPDGFDMASPANQGSDDAKDSDGPISDVVSLDAGESDLTIDSGFFKKPLGTIGDRVWFDTDGDGNQDAGEDGINGVTVKLIDKNTGNVVDTQTTSGDGGYLFDGVSAGDYTVMVDESTLPANLVQTGDPDATLDNMSMVTNFPAGGEDLHQDFGYRELLGTIGDRVWFDTDGDGNQDAGEDGINGVTVKLIDKNTGNVVDTEVTSGDGGYLFDGVSAGDYTVMVDESTLPANLVQTGDPDATLDNMSMVTNFPAGGEDLHQDFGYRELLGTIGDRVWFDTDGDGNQDAGEDGINGVTVKLIDKNTGNVVDTQTTSGDGGYLFDGVSAGDYTVMVDESTLPANLVQTGDPDATLDDMSMVVNFPAGGTNLDQDFGYRELLGTIGDRVWFDTDGDGNQDAGEDGINGVTVKLIDKNTGNVVDTQTTSGDGGYLFDGVSAGDYTVMVDESTLPANLVQTGDPDATLDDMSMVVNFPAGGTNLDQDFGYRELLGTIGDRVWFDTDGDGNQDAGEDGINGVTVKLIDKNTGNVVDTEVTSGDGGYLFDGVSAGDYTVMVDESTLPANLVQTGDPDATLDDMSMVVNFPAGGTNLDQDFGYQPGNPDIDIEKFVNGIDVTDINDLPEIEAGADVTFTYEVTNTGNVAFNLSDIVVVDDDGTPGNTADDFTPQLVNSSDVNGDNVLSPGETWLYKSQTVAAQDLTTATADKDVRFTLTGNSPLDGPDGNVRTFTKDGVSVDVSAFSRNSHGWQKAYLGAYGGGLGVTNKYESGSAHRIDNRGSRDYVLFEFAEDVTVDRAFLDYIGHDSDISVWIGDRNGADISHLSDSILNGFTKENNFGGRYSRWADFNSGELKGDTVVISAYTNHSNDAFKLKKLDVSVHGETEIGVYKNTVTVTADSASDSDMSGYTNPEPTQALSSLGDRVWHDTNRNGIQDSGESGVGGVTVTLTGGGNDGKIGTADDTTATATTNSNGTYGFDNLNPGEEYKLTFELPSNAFEFTSANSGGNDAKDSDVDPSTGMTQIVTLAPGENNSTLDAGIREAKVDLGIHKEVTNVTAGSRWSAIGYSDDIAYPLDIMRYDITVTNHSNVTATGIVVEDIVPENFDIAEPGQTVSDTGMGWNQNGRHFDSRVWWGRAYQGSVDVIDSTNGTVSIVDPGVAHTGLTLAPGQSYGLPEGSVTWELGDSLAPGESVTLSYFGKREVYSAYNWNTGTQFFTDASITHVDQHDSNPHNDSDSGRSWWISPITFDLNGDGIQTRSIDQGVKFDLLNTGEAVNTGWISGNDGFLAIDNNGDGVISDRSELFGGGVGDGFAKLASFDSNGDALVNEADAQFGALKLWQDANENGVTDQGELVSLASVGITDLSTDYTNVFKADAQGNIHGEVSTAVKNGNSIEMTDVYFQVAV